MDINDALTVSLYSLIPGTGTQAFNHLRGPRPSCRPALCQETFKPKGGGRFNAAICNPKSLAKGQSKWTFSFSSKSKRESSVPASYKSICRKKGCQAKL